MDEVAQDPPSTDPASVRRDGSDLDELNRSIQADVAAGGDVFHTGAQLRNGYCQRAAIVSWRTTADDTRALADAVVEAGARLAG